MEYRAISSIREIVRLIFIGALTLFFISEIVLVQDVYFVPPAFILATSGIAIILWRWG